MATYRFKATRYLRKYTAPARTPTYSAATDAQAFADALCELPWQRAATDGSAITTSHVEADLDRNAENRELIDAALWCGEHKDGLHRAYGQAACYRMTLPQTFRGQSLAALKVRVTCDPYNAAGARIALATNSTGAIPTACADCRTGSVHADGVSPRTVSSDGKTWYAHSEDCTLAPSGGLALGNYLYLFVLLEEPAYSRGGWLESCAYIAPTIEATFADAVTGYADGESVDCTDANDGVLELHAGGSSPTWLQPPATVNAGTSAPSVPQEPIVETFYTDLRTKTTSLENTINTFFQNPQSQSNQIACTIKIKGSTVQSVTVGTSGNMSKVSGSQQQWVYTSTVTVDGRIFTTTYNCSLTITVDGDYIKVSGTTNMYSSNYSGVPATVTIGERTLTAFARDNYYVALTCEDTVPVSMDKSDTADASGHRGLQSTVEVVTSGQKWKITLDGNTYYVTYTASNNKVAFLNSSNSQLYSWTSSYVSSPTFFDASVSVHLNNATVTQLGLAAACGDFSAAVATYESGTQPSHEELLGRLVRLSRNTCGGMSYLYPAHGAFADELDVLRPVPRFYRAATAPSDQTACQPGLSAWYRRPTVGSSASASFAYRGEVVAVSAVSNPVFLQYALLALRASADVLDRIELVNSGSGAVHNDFALRFVAWVSPANEWDRSNGYAMAALASMPSVYRHDGPSDVSWTVDCAGSLMPFGSRSMTARRLGVSEVVTGTIAASASIPIKFTEGTTVGAGDVVLVAPEVVSFASSGSASSYFGRQADPNTNTHDYAWARYAENLGWFPQVKGK